MTDPLFSTTNPPAWFQSLDTLQHAGFEGFRSVAELRESGCAAAPAIAGVYLVFRDSVSSPYFLKMGSGGRFKGRSPDVDVDVLQANWVDGARLLYVGKAGGATLKATLKSRLRAYMRFGSGLPVGHWGGRFIWQLEDAEDLIVCWKPLAVDEPALLESELIRQFRAHYGQRPFANLKK